MALVLATHNPHKVLEVRRILEPRGFAVEPLDDGFELPPEDGLTFAENALGKARAVAEVVGQLVIADDSGIEAEALGGRPGVRSARYAGPGVSDEENLRKLIDEVPSGSPLRYVCAVACVDAWGEGARVFFGECRGRMAAEARGGRGFGYDPVFVPVPQPRGGAGERTMSELTEAEKDAISHRGHALRALAEGLDR